jgi:hypothetical protein
MDGEDEPDAKEALFASGESGCELMGVVRRDLDLGIDEASLCSVASSPGLEAGELSTETLGGELGRDWFDVDRHVEATRMVRERLKPAEVHLAWVAGDDERATPLVTEMQRPGMDLD